MRALEQEAAQVRGMQRAEDDPHAGRAEEPKWRIKPLKFGGENVHTAAREATWWRWLTRPLHGLQGAHPGWRGAKEPDMVQKRCHQMRCQE
eukprot:7599363-Pyramimonas_sp.AAC.1